MDTEISSFYDHVFISLRTEILHKIFLQNSLFPISRFNSFVFSHRREPGIGCFENWLAQLSLCHCFHTAVPVRLYIVAEPVPNSRINQRLLLQMYIIHPTIFVNGQLTKFLEICVIYKTDILMKSVAAKFNLIHTQFSSRWLNSRGFNF